MYRFLIIFLLLPSVAFGSPESEQCRDLVVVNKYFEAFNFCHKAAEQGHIDAQFNLGLMFSKGLGVAQDYKEAVLNGSEKLRSKGCRCTANSRTLS
jgi:hypothetical protein